MAKVERKDDGRRCAQCKGPQGNGVMPRFVRTEELQEEATLHTGVDLHGVCVGAYLMSHPSYAVRFRVGEL